MKIRNRIFLKKIILIIGHETVVVTSIFRSFWQLVLKYMYYVEFTELLYAFVSSVRIMLPTNQQITPLQK